MTHFVSIIIPVRNELNYIDFTMNSLLNQDYPRDFMEIIVADGMSDDGTREKLEVYVDKFHSLKLVDNKPKIVSAALNNCIAIAKGDVIIRMDAHSVYPTNYISVLVENLYALDADNVGVKLETIPFSSSPKSLAIAKALSHPLGVGNSWFRIGIESVKQVDTVPFGCFRREVFNQIGGFDLELIRNQDDELNARMIKNGMKIFLIPDISVKYYARESISILWKMYYQYGYFKPLVNLKIKKISSLRQLAPLALVSYLILGVLVSLLYPIALSPFLLFLLPYLLIIVGISFWNFKALGSFTACFWLMISFSCMHISYGLGYLVGFLSILTKQGRGEKFSLSR
ncbi:glycosyltransferase family 2 protein [Ancylomarina sp.]|uniref:glycosyltransferase family 2 protein n=1 Tax=Ancylomarina sp. TaxID=1970196 RepID=UPI00356436A2